MKNICFVQFLFFKHALVGGTMNENTMEDLVGARINMNLQIPHACF